MIAERSDLFEFVRDVEDCGAFRAEFAQGFEQDFDFLRGEDRSRLIHNQQFGFLQQAADNLDALAFACGEVAYDAVGRQRQAIGFGDLRDPG